MFKKILVIGLFAALICFSVTGQQSKSFEMRYFSNNPTADGETDFKGSTSVFNTEKRVEFLMQYTEFANDFFKDSNFDYEVISNSEAAEVALNIKPQPNPVYRNRIFIKNWKWIGYREGLEKKVENKRSKYNVDVIGSNDKIEPVAMNWNKGKTVNVTIKILDPGKNEVARNEYKNIHLDGGRTFRPLETFKPEGIKEGHYFVIYEIK